MEATVPRRGGDRAADENGAIEQSGHPAHNGRAAVPKAPSASAETARDPICGMLVTKASALTLQVGGRTHYFCSEGCRRTFEAPDEELRNLKRRVSIAMTGVLFLAMLRAAVFLGLAAGATALTWAPIPGLPWFTWGVWMMILVTPVQFIGG